MKKILNFSLMLLVLASFTSIDATASSCDPCAGTPWTTTGYISFSFTIPYRPGCTYNAYVVYYTRSCMGQTEDSVNWNATIFEQTDTSSGCNLTCPPDCPTLHQIVLNQIMSLTGPMLQSDPSPCFYLGSIVVPPGAEACYGLTPGSKRYVMLPCDTNGCCFAQITPAGPATYNETVLSSTSCPPAPTIPDSSTISWSCDIGHGVPGSLTFNVPFTPDSPHVCEMTCSSGIMGPAPKYSNNNTTPIPSSVISALKLYPNPVGDVLHIAFNAQASGKTINIEIYDLAGRNIASTALVTVAGQQEANVNTHDLAPGSYICRVKYSGGTVDTKFTK